MPLVRVAKCRDPESKRLNGGEVVMLRHDLRKLALNDGSLKIPEHEVGVTASYDGAISWATIAEISGIVASRLPEDENDVATSFGQVDLPIFECALGLGGFDEEFEKQARKCGILFGLLDVDASLNEVSKNVGPSLLRAPRGRHSTKIKT